MTQVWSRGWHAQRTLQINPDRSLARSIIWLALFLVSYTLLSEAIVRTDSLASRLGPRSLGSEHGQFEEQWSRLEKYADTHGSVDCVFVGDSTVMLDFAPIPFGKAYQKQSGKELACYNFGVGAFSVEGTAMLARLLDHEYAPQLLIVGLEPLNFTVARDEQGAAALSALPWARYRLGDFSLEGWAYDNVHLLGYLRPLSRILMLALYDAGVLLPGAEEPNAWKDGYYPFQGTGPFDVSKPPDPAIDHPYLEHYFAAHADFELLPENLEALEQILGMNSSTQVVVVEMPLASTFQAFFGNGEEDYREFVTSVSERASEYGVPFYRMSEPDMLPPNLWYNYNHLNAEGAPIFSSWLGQALGLAEQR